MRVLAWVLLVALGVGSASPAWSRDRESWPKGEILARTSEAHDRAYWVYVPKAYTKKRSWPVVISSHGRGGTGEREMRPWRTLADKHGFIVACPDMVTATNHRPKTSSLPAAQEDDEVLVSILDAVGARFRVSPRAVMITGFSGGGNPSYHTGLRHPDRITHICTRGGNFAPQQMPRDEAVLEAGRERTRILIFYGEKDHPLIVGEGGQPGQAQQAFDALKGAGYGHVTLEEVPGMKHESRPAKAAAWFAAWLEENGKALKAGDKADDLLRKAEGEVSDGRPYKAVPHLHKARALQEKHPLLRPTAQARLDALEALAREAMAAAQALKEAGQDKQAEKALRDVTRTWRGLDAAREAAALLKTWS